MQLCLVCRQVTFDRLQATQTHAKRFQVGSFGPGTGAGRGRGRGRRSSAVTLLKRNTVRPGSKLVARMDLAAAGGGYLKGTLGSFGQFGKDGKVRVSIAA